MSSRYCHLGVILELSVALVPYKGEVLLMSSRYCLIWTMGCFGILEGWSSTDVIYGLSLNHELFRCFTLSKPSVVLCLRRRSKMNLDGSREFVNECPRRKEKRIVFTVACTGWLAGELKDSATVWTPQRWFHIWIYRTSRLTLSLQFTCKLCVGNKILPTKIVRSKCGAYSAIISFFLLWFFNRYAQHLSL